MTFDEFSKGLISLANDHGKDLTAGQIAAYYKVLGHYDARDWAWAVVRMTAASHFPKNHREMQDELERMQADRKRREADQERGQANNFFRGALPVPDDRMGALMQRCCFHLIRYTGTEKSKAVDFVKTALADPEFAQYCKDSASQIGGGEAVTDWTWLHQQIEKAPGHELGERMPDDAGMD